MQDSNHKLVVDPTYGHRRLDPMPSSAELGAFYESQYYHLIRQGGRAPELQRLLAGGPDADRERAWLRHTLHGDIAETLLAHAPGKRVLDVGCGTGDLVGALCELGLDAEGIEPADEAAAMGRERGLRIHTAEIAQFAREAHPFHAATLLNVLEHVPEPAAVLESVSRLLTEDGVLCVRVPNDFSRIQQAAGQFLDKTPWWIAVPDHVNYFDYDSLLAFLDGHGFDPFEVEGDFPMEVFLLLGMDYVSDSEIGSSCHAQRVDLEMKLSREDRRSLYRGLARGGLGRNSMVFARRRSAARARVDMSGLEQSVGEYRYAALRRTDIQAVRGWRNEQHEVLRQQTPIGAEDQERWFRELVSPTHRSADPDFLLVHIRDADDTLIGYGGLTNIDWGHGRAEVSFLAATDRAENRDLYARDFACFLEFLKTWAFEDLGLRRLYTETYAFREHHIGVLEAAEFAREGRLVAHVVTGGRRVDSLLHGVVRG